ncbi:unnamed protein product [Protopolystoma xenopodis]|uniref:Uncharacterized protein n=1 Tax=Protopolystoma xenopodis TaxID=117903 RepID=A0A448X3G2_9PLAT|nr:unnamed protein product [Protopolystoma xenopodis]
MILARAAGLIKTVTQTADESLVLNSQRDEDAFFREEKCNLAAYYQAVKEATQAADASTRQRRTVADSLLQLGIGINSLLQTYERNTPESK